MKIGALRFHAPASGEDGVAELCSAPAGRFSGGKAQGGPAPQSGTDSGPHVRQARRVALRAGLEDLNDAAERRGYIANVMTIAGKRIRQALQAQAQGKTPPLPRDDFSGVHLLGRA